jgi:eukaryotic-like serine/threonine-protein kinase
MPLNVACPNPSCAWQYSLSESVAGRKTRCKGCGQTFVIGDSATGNGSKAPAPAPVSQPSPSHTNLQTVGRFVVRGKLGSGAFGTVYRAFDPNLNREVALKVPNPGVMTEPKRAERFLREAKAAANLRHPHIVPVFDAGKDGDHYFIASAFIDGKPLSDAIPEGGMEFALAARIVRELAEALAYAHEQGIVHRDVKPANTMLDTRYHVHLMDFGLAARRQEESRLTNDGAVMGTVAYMSPETARGHTDDPRPTADQYSVGVVLYELLTGQTPFTGPPLTVLHQIMYVDPEPPRRIRPAVPMDLQVICLKAMAKRPEDRYADCQALADDLRRWIVGEPVVARGLSGRERAVRWVKKEPKLSIAAGTVVLALLISVVFVSSAARQAEGARQQAENERGVAQAADERTRQAVKDKLGGDGTVTDTLKRLDAAQAQAKNLQERVKVEQKNADDLRAQLAAERKQHAETVGAFEARSKGLEAKSALDFKQKLIQRYAVQLAYEYHERGEVDGARAVLELMPEARRGWEWRHVQKLCTPPGQPTPPVRRKGMPGELSAIGPDGMLFAHVDSNNRVQVNNAKGDPLRTFKGHTGTPRWMVFSADGKQMATVGAEGTVQVWATTTTDQALVLQIPLIRTIDTVRDTRARLSQAAFSPDGKRLVTAGLEPGAARIWNVQTAGAPVDLKGDSYQFVLLAVFSPDGQRVATASLDRTVRVWDANNGKILAQLEKSSDVVNSVAFNPDGSRVLIASSDKTARVWKVSDQKELLALREETPICSAAFSPDGTRIVTVAEAVTRIWDAESGAVLLSFNFRPNRVRSATWSSDGSELFLEVQDGLEGGFEIRDGGPPPPAPRPKP